MEEVEGANKSVGDGEDRGEGGWRFAGERWEGHGEG